ncbi:MAG TPA: hypothetical protein VET25_04325 [Aestuariivirgaceae bacterium]|nr:hypothetical protein [Aestuariivirgaceae bacterium]
MSPVKPRHADDTSDGTPACVRQPEDWQPCELKTLVRHLPTHTIFELYPVSHKQPDDVLELADFCSRLVHVCEGYSAPPPHERTRLCREAVLMGLHYLGLVEFAGSSTEPSEIDDDEIPF